MKRILATAFLCLVLAPPAWAENEGYVECGSLAEVEKGGLFEDTPEKSDFGPQEALDGLRSVWRRVFQNQDHLALGKFDFDNPKLDTLRDSLSQLEKKFDDINTNDFDVSPENKEKAINEGVYIFPCGILWDENRWNEYWPEWRAYALKRKRESAESSRKHKKYMDCMYGHRKEMNEQNRQFIDNKCRKDAYDW
jgi:hypothetical protein